MPDRTARAWPPRGMPAWDAAYYCGISESTFRGLVARGIAPQAVQITEGRRVWLREDLDAYLDRKAGRTAASEPMAEAEDPFMHRRKQLADGTR